MDAERFVAAVREHVMDSAVEETISVFVSPPGRQPAPELVALSQWYLGLAPDDRVMVGRALAEASHGAVFGLFAVLDGCRRIDDEKTPCEFQLWYEGRDGRVLLNGVLHEILNSESWYR